MNKEKMPMKTTVEFRRKRGLSEKAEPKESPKFVQPVPAWKILFVTCWPYLQGDGDPQVNILEFRLGILTVPHLGKICSIPPLNVQ